VRVDAVDQHFRAICRAREGDSLGADLDLETLQHDLVARGYQVSVGTCTRYISKRVEGCEVVEGADGRG
jgi:hypothetical protein